MRHPFQLLVAILLVVSSHTAFSNSLILSPGTLVLNDQRRAGAISVGTSDEGAATIEVKNSFFRQRDDGQLIGADPATAKGSVAHFLRVGPRRFVVQSGRGKQVRVAVRPPNELPPGEYRIHLTVTAVGESALEPSESVTAETQSGAKVIIPIRVARAVRLLYRHKVTPKGGALEGVKYQLDSGDAVVGFEVVRQGETSLLAETSVVAITNHGTVLSRWPGPTVSLYKENDRRGYSVRVPREDIPLNSKLCVRLSFTDSMAQNLKPVTRCVE